jgi:hypothetical protein
MTASNGDRQFPVQPADSVAGILEIKREGIECEYRLLAS